MRDTVAGFDWDKGNRDKCRKHGVSIAEIEAILLGNPTIAPDVKHMAGEDRFIAVGRNSAGRPIFVAFTFRMKQKLRLIRPVSARYMHVKEAANYEKESSQAND